MADFRNERNSYGEYGVREDYSHTEEHYMLFDGGHYGTIDELINDYFGGAFDYSDNFYALLSDVYGSFSEFPQDCKDDIEIASAAIRFGDDYSIDELTPEVFEYKENVMILLDRIDERSNEYDKYNAFMELFNKGVDSDVLADKEVALRWVTYRADTLQDVSPELRDDKDVVMAAVKHDSQALKYASDNMKNDMEVAVAALRETDSYGVIYAGIEITDNKEFALKAIDVNPNNYEWISNRLQFNEEVVTTLLKKDETQINNVPPGLKHIMKPIHNLYEITNAEDYKAFMNKEWKENGLSWYSSFDQKKVYDYEELKKHVGSRGNMYFRPYYNSINTKDEIIVYTNKEEALKDLKNDIKASKSCVVNQIEEIKVYKPKQIERLDTLALDYQCGNFDKHIGKISSFEDKSVTAIMKYGKDWHKHWKDMRPITEYITERQAAKKPKTLDEKLKEAQTIRNNNNNPDKDPKKPDKGLSL